ncbi:hypothetical protein ACFX12_007774 [Malus domestica]
MVQTRPDVVEINKVIPPSLEQQNTVIPPLERLNIVIPPSLERLNIVIPPSLERQNTVIPPLERLNIVIPPSLERPPLERLNIVIPPSLERQNTSVSPSLSKIRTPLIHAPPSSSNALLLRVHPLEHRSSVQFKGIPPATHIETQEAQNTGEFMVSGQWVSEDSGFEIRNLGWVQVFGIGRVSME